MDYTEAIDILGAGHVAWIEEKGEKMARKYAAEAARKNRTRDEAAYLTIAEGIA